MSEQFVAYLSIWLVLKCERSQRSCLMSEFHCNLKTVLIEFSRITSQKQ